MVQNGRISYFHGVLTLTLTLDPGMVITFFISHRVLTLYTKFHRNRRNFLWMDAWTDVRTDGNLPPIVLGRLPKFGSRPKNRPEGSLSNFVKFLTREISNFSRFLGISFTKFVKSLSENCETVISRNALNLWLHCFTLTYTPN